MKRPSPTAVTAKIAKPPHAPDGMGVGAVPNSRRAPTADPDRYRSRTDGAFRRRLRREVVAATSEILRASENAKSLKEYNENILSSLTSGVIVVDLDGAVTTFNREASAVFRATAADVIGRCLRDVPRLEPLGRLLARTMETGIDIHRNELTVTAFDGREIPLGVSTSLLHGQTDGTGGAIAIFTDLSKTKSLEERVRHSEKLAVLGEMAAVMAHEIRNPLNSVAGFGQLLQMKIAETGHLRKYVDIIVHEAFRIDSLISDILDFAHQKKNTISDIDFSLLADKVISAKLATAASKGVRLDARIAPGLQVFRGDTVRLERVILNLVNNGIEATDCGGSVTLAVATAARAGVVGVELTVADTGSGIAPENIESIFKPFFTTKQTGTGLGLAIIQKIAEEHGGTVTVASSPGEGATFTLYLPGNENEPAENIP